MTTPAPPGIVQPPWSAAFPADWRGRILTTIVEGAPFSRSCAPMPTNRTSVAFGILDVGDPEWGAELDEVPDLAKDQTAYEIAVSRLSGSILISEESISDGDFSLTQQVGLVLVDTFSNKLDRDLIGAAGPAPIPAGILSVAAEVTAADWELAAIAAKAQMATAGGTATHITLSPAVLGVIESARDDLGRQLYPGAAQVFAGLQTVSAVGASAPVVYARDRVSLVVNRDFSVEVSRETDSAWRHFARSLRVVARFALAVPQPSKACRKLALTAGTQAAGSHRSGKAA